MYWAFADETVQRAGAIPPEPLELGYGCIPDGQRLRGTDLQRAHLRGRKVQPADCPPIRVIARYGFLVRSPGAVAVDRVEPHRWPNFGAAYSEFGTVRVSGDKWPEGDSGFVASWISGADFVKVHTGIRIYFPADHLLYMGPLPNSSEIPSYEVGYSVMAGAEYFRVDNSATIAGERYGISTVNVIVKIPDLEGASWKLAAGEPLAWLIAIPKRQQMAPL